MSNDLISTKPYLLRALHEWCVDNNLTPHLLVQINAKTRVPMAYVKAGEIVLNLSYGATKDLHIDNESIVFSARFNGVSQHLYVPMSAVKGIFARENGQGMMFEPEYAPDDEQLNDFEMLKIEIDAKAELEQSALEQTEAEQGYAESNQQNENASQQKSAHQKPKLTIVK